MTFDEFSLPPFAEPELVVRFFTVFSRFEYALKCDGWTLSKQGAVSADWSKFALCLSPHFDKDRTAELREASDYLLGRPPQKQALRGGRLTWEPGKITARSELEVVLLYVRRTRNNLFHGGKSSPGSPMQMERNADLMRHGLTVLAECLRICREQRPRLVDYFEGR